MQRVVRTIVIRGGLLLLCVVLAGCNATPIQLPLVDAIGPEHRDGALGGENRAVRDAATPKADKGQPPPPWSDASNHADGATGKSDALRDGVKGDGVKGDGVKGDGVKGDGRGGDGLKGDGLKGDKPKGDGLKKDGAKGDVGKDGGSNLDGAKKG